MLHSEDLDLFDRELVLRGARQLVAVERVRTAGGVARQRTVGVEEAQVHAGAEPRPVRRVVEHRARYLAGSDGEFRGSSFFVGTGAVVEKERTCVVLRCIRRCPRQRRETADDRTAALDASNDDCWPFPLHTRTQRAFRDPVVDLDHCLRRRGDERYLL